jgi:uncharacterized membrane protein HdeD (DUF308 family)
MFNLVMGVIMIGIGIVSLIFGSVGKVNPVLIFFGCAMVIFGITETIRSRSIRRRNKDRKQSEMDAYLRMASEMGVVVNPITKEVVQKKETDNENRDDT